MEQIETVIIGGGQAGLSTGYYLQQQRRDFVILDAHEHIGDAWRKRWDSLRLFTPARYSGLAGMPFPAPAFAYPTKDAMADYLESYATRFRLPVKPSVRVDKLSRQGDRFVVAAGDLRFEAENVVVATGGYPAPRIPAFSAELDPAIRQLHSSEYRRPSQLQEGGVLVVGAGNSGAEIALEVSRTHRTWLSGRHPGNEPTRAGSKMDRLVTPLIWFVFSHVATINTPLGRKVAPELRSHGLPLARVRPTDLLAAKVERIQARTVGARDGQPQLADGRVLDVTNVIWCTGFQPTYDWIALPIFGDGEPIHERGVVATQPGLYFVGLFFQSAATSSLVGGVGRDAAYIADRIAARASAVAKPEGCGAYMSFLIPDYLRWHWRNVPLPEPHLGLLAAGLILQRVRPKPLSSVGRIRCVTGWCCIASGIALAAWATGAAAELDLERPDRLVTLGPYAMSRNPMYVGWIGIYLGMALVTNTRWLILLSPMLLALVHFTTFAEERELGNRFGDNYQAYKRQVRRYL